MSRYLTLISVILVLISNAVYAADENCPADLPIADINFIEHDVKFRVVNPIPIEKFESEKTWEQLVGDVKVTARLSLQESKTKKRILPKDRELYAIELSEYSYGTSYEATITFDDLAVEEVVIEHSSLTGSAVYPASVGTLERAFGGAIQILCPKADVIPTLH